MQKKTTSLASFQLLIILLVVHVLCLKQSFGQNTQTFDALRQVQGMMDRDLDSALIAIERFETRYKEVIHTGMSEETALLHAQIYIGLGQMHQADSLINFVKNRPIKNSSPEYRARLFLFKSMAYELEEMYPTAVWQLNQAEAIFLDLNDNQGRLDVYQQFAKIYSKLGNYAKAIEMTERLISLHQDLESEEIEMDLLLQGSEYANKMQNLDLQHDFLIKAESLIIANSMNKHSAKLLYAWANYLRSSANFKQAIDYYNVAEKEIEKSKNRRFLCLIYQEKAAIYKMELNEFGQILYLKRALQEAEKLQDKQLIIKAKLALGLAYFEQTKIDSSQFYVDAVMKDKYIGSWSLSAIDLKKRILIEKRQFEKALKTLEERKELNDRLLSKQLDKEMTSSKLEDDLSKFDEEKNTIEKQLDLKQLVLQNHLLSIRLIIVSGGFILLALILFYFLLKVKNKKRNNLLYQRLIFLQLNAHFIFNSLTAIQSLIIKSKVVVAEHYLQLFADIMQYFLKSSNRVTVPLHEELSFEMGYLQIQKLRFGEDLKYELRIDEQVDPQLYYTPPFLIFPYIEFAIETLIQKNGANGSIHIVVKKENRFLLIEIHDNGIGFLSSDQAFLKRPIQSKIALNELTKERLKSLNGLWNKKYFVHLISESNGSENISILQFKIKQ